MLISNMADIGDPFDAICLQLTLLVAIKSQSTFTLPLVLDANILAWSLLRSAKSHSPTPSAYFDRLEHSPTHYCDGGNGKAMIFQTNMKKKKKTIN